MPFFTLATYFKTFLLRHVQKVDQKLNFLDEKVTYIFRPVLSVRFNVGVSLLLAPTRAD